MTSDKKPLSALLEALYLVVCGPDPADELRAANDILEETIRLRSERPVSDADTTGGRADRGSSGRVGETSSAGCSDRVH